jgi:hypothetical protein
VGARLTAVMHFLLLRVFLTYLNDYIKIKQWLYSNICLKCVMIILEVRLLVFCNLFAAAEQHRGEGLFLGSSFRLGKAPATPQSNLTKVLFLK